MSKKIVTYNNLKEFKVKYDQQVQSYMGITRGTLIAGRTSIALTDSRIRSDSVINVYTSVYGISPSDVSIAGQTATITFANAQNANIEVGIMVLN